MARIRYGSLPTERSNPRSARLDRLSVTAIARLMNRVDQDAVRAVGRAAPAIGKAVTEITERLRAGGRLLFLGAGTSGRPGGLGAAGWPPTLNPRSSPGQGVGAGR